MKNYLKYFKLVRLYVKYRWAIEIADLELLLFLHPEKIFNARRLKLAQIGMKWDKKRIESLVNRGLIGVVREKPSKLYSLTPLANRIINGVYRKLNGEEGVPDTRWSNPMYRGDAPYAQRNMRLPAEELNESIKRQRRRALELPSIDDHQ
jgi:hypothetical protein